ncbi:MAG: hypothetical protein ACKO5Q_19315, partial [Microcystaceae cyanobacterium]
QQRQAKAEWLTLGNAELQQKLKFAKEFAKAKVISSAEIAYRTDEDLLVQEAQQSDKIDEEWRKRLESLELSGNQSLTFGSEGVLFLVLSRYR